MSSSLPSSPDLGGGRPKPKVLASGIQVLLSFGQPPPVLPVGHQAPTGHRVNGMKLSQLTG